MLGIFPTALGLSPVRLPLPLRDPGSSQFVGESGEGDLVTGAL